MNLPVEIRTFLSYAHADDEQFVFVTPFVEKLKALVEIKSGRSLRIFVDRDSLKWGDGWRDEISKEVENASLFIPMLTANYLSSQNCRDEFIAFHSSARALGVSELLLPVLPFKSSLFTEDSDDEVVKMAVARQWVCLEPAILKMGDSPEWLEMMAGIADDLLSALSKAEEALSRSIFDDEGPAAVAAEGGADGGSDVDGEELGLADFLGEFQSGITGMVVASEKLQPVLEALGSAVSTVPELKEDPSPKDLQVWSLNAAQRLKGPSGDLESVGGDLYVATKRLDEAISGIRTVIAQADPVVSKELNESLDQAVESLGDLSEARAGMGELLQQMQYAEIMSAAIRKALAPARRGITRVSDSLSMVASWGPRVGAGSE